MKKVLVLMSTYNGTTYLAEQVDSILQQTDVQVELLVRDDGSTDGTQDFLQQQQECGRLNWYQGENVGPAQSFLSLLRDAPQADYYALADQDDVWLPQKLSTAIQHLANAPQATPALYFGQTLPVDSHLQPLPYVPLTPCRTLGEALIHYFVGGNTMVLNHDLRQWVNRHTPQHIEMHDVYLYALALALGSQVVFDPTPHILYRQHSGNVVGSPKSQFWGDWKKRLHRILHQQELRSHMAIEIWKGYAPHLKDETRNLLHDFVEAKRSFKARLALLSDSRLRCSHPATQRMFRIALLLNTY